MKQKTVHRLLAGVLSAILITGSLPVYAEEQNSLEIISEDPATSDSSSLSSEDIVENEATEVKDNTVSEPAVAAIAALQEEHTDLTIDDKGVVTVLAEGYDIPSDVKDLSVAVWSRENGQDDLKWYPLQKTDKGLTVKVDLKNHGAKDDMYYFHLYYKSATDQMVCFSIKNYEVSGVFKTSLEAIESQTGYQLVLTNPTTTPKSVEFAIWSNEGGQDDLKWFPATYDASEKRAVCNWDLSNLKHLGDVTIHCYVNDLNGKKVYQGPLKVNLSKPEVGKIEASYNPTTGKYTVNISEIKNGGFIKKIEVPVWSDSKQADLKWQDAVKNADGTYSVTTPISFHAGKTGTYQVHVYLTDKTGDRVCVGKTTFTVGSSETEPSTPDPAPSDPVVVDSKTEEILSGTSTCEIRAINYSALEGAKNVRVAFWSDKNGQDDLYWYPLTKKTEVIDGKSCSVWYKKVDLKNHDAANGKYYAHIYYDNAAGKPVCVSPYSFMITDFFTAPVETNKTTVEAIESNGSYKLVLTDANIDPKGGVTFAVWSDTNGQDDLKWYETTYDSAKKQAVRSWSADNLKHDGVVNIHCYAKDAKGTMVFQGKTTVEIKGLSLQSAEAAFSQSSGKFTIKANSLSGVANKMEAAVWADARQADLKWYPMTGDGSGNWTYSGNISNHGYRTGTYNVHIYATDPSGKKVCLAKTTFTAQEAGSVSIKTVKANDTYQVVVSDLNSTIVKSVSAAVWSDQGGQDDLKWYTASKSGSNYIATIPIQQHKTAGHYTVHVYVNKTDGSSYNSAGLRTGFDVSEDISTEYAFTDRQTDNGTFVIHMIAAGYIPAKSVTFNVWTDKNGQDDLESVPAEKQADGSWAAIVNPAKHGFEAGTYCMNSVLTFENGTTFTSAETAYTVSEETAFYTVVASEESATAILRGYTDASSVKIYVWSTNGGQDDLKAYTPVKTEDGWTVEILKKNHGSAGQYNAHVYVDDVLVATDFFSFDAYRLADSWYSISSAHGAGGQGAGKNEIYTNCVTAMNNSYAEGYRTFEIDVLLTKDQQPVLFHTWTTDILDHYKYSSTTANGPSYQEFMSDTMYGGKYKTSDYKSLLTYLKQHPDVKILLDTKYRTAAELKQLYTILLQTATSMSAVSNMKNQIIPYFFAPDQLSAIRSVCEFKEYHYATYAAYRWQNGVFPIEDFRSVLQFCKMNRVLSLSMWDSLATADMIRMADSYGITVYVHTTDDAATADRLLSMGAAGIITNKITPVQAIGFIS